MTEKERLRKLLELGDENLGLYAVTKDGRRAGKGCIPKHYKRITIPEDERKRLAKIGTVEILSCFGETLFYTQAVIAGAVLSGDYHKIGIISPSQYGKLLADDTPVLTRNGWKNHCDLRVGDEVISPDGRFVKVEYVHPKGEANRVVTFRNGDQIVCHENHEWVVLDRSAKRVHTVETGWMERRGVTDSKGRNKFLVQPIEPLQGEHKDLAVDPYVMGVWLGDGATTKGQITEGAEDIAVLERVREVYPKGSAWVHKDTGAPTWSFNGLMRDLRTYGMGITKRIPDEYLTASLEQRLQLLAGLMDTDGYCFPGDSRCYFVTANEDIRYGFETLISTFGWRFSTVAQEPCVSSSGVHGRKTVYTIGFNPSFDIPCVLERKRPRRLAKQRNLGITGISPCKPVRGNCITVEGGVYCVGRHLIPTHNSFLMGMIAIWMAFNGTRVNVAASTGDKTEIIMQYCQKAASQSDKEIKDALVGESLKKVDRLGTSLSKTMLNFARGGHVLGLTLGDTYEGVARNKAVGRGGAYIVDEAALVSSSALAELGRRELASVEGRKDPLIMISNPHSPGAFYDFITQEEMGPGECVIWMDALTAVQEQRWPVETVMTSDFTKEKDTIQRYWLCELPSQGAGMFDEPIVRKEEKRYAFTTKVMGIDAAYKGKDAIEVCIAEIEPENIYFREVYGVKPKEWVDGVTSKDLIERISRAYRMSGCEICCVDIGFGVWLLEGLLQHGVNAKGVNFAASPTRARVKANHYAAKNAANMRAELHMDLADMMENQACDFSPEVFKEIEEVLPLVEKELKQSGKYQIIPKAEIKAKIGHSPDAFDAVLLALHAAILYSDDAISYMVE